jgi:Tfp pilus assembly protein PilX
LKDPTHRTDARSGSIYLVVLVTVAVVTTMVLTGIKLRTSSNSEVRSNIDRANARTAARSAVEIALVQLNRDHDQFVTNAKTSTVMSSTSIGDATIKLSATDKDTGLKVTDSTTTMRINATGNSGGARTMVGFDLSSNLTTAYLSELVSRGAISYWSLNEVAGSATAADNIGGFDGAYKNKFSAGGDKFLDTDFAPYIRSASTAIVIDHARNFEVEEGALVFWAKSNSSRQAPIQAVVSKWQTNSAPLNLLIYISSGWLCVQIDSHYSDQDQTYYVSGSAFEDKGWHHVAYTFGSAGSQIYIDGVSVNLDKSNTIGLANSRFGREEVNDSDWVIGGIYPNNLSYPLDGSVARFAFFPTQLSATDIAELKDAQLNSKLFTVVDGSFAREVD